MAMTTTFMEHDARDWNDGSKCYLIYGNIAIEYSTINEYEIEKNSKIGVKRITIVLNCKDEANRFVGHRVTISFSDSKEEPDLIATQIDIFQSDKGKRRCKVRRGIAKNGFLFGKYQIFQESRYKMNTMVEKEENENESESVAMMRNGNLAGVSLNDDTDMMVFASGTFKRENDNESKLYESESCMKSPPGLPSKIANNGILFDKYQILQESQYQIDIRLPNILMNVGSRNMNLTPSNSNSIDSLACNIEEKIDDNALCREEQEKKESINTFATFNNENDDGESIGKGGNFGWGVITDEKEISELAAAVKHRGMVKKVLDGDIDSSLVFARFRFQRDVIEADRFFEDKLCQMKGLSKGIIEPVGYVLSPHSQMIAVFMIANYDNKPNEIYEKQKEMVIAHLKARFGNNNNYNGVNDKIWFDSYGFPENPFDTSTNTSENSDGSKFSNKTEMNKNNEKRLISSILSVNRKRYRNDLIANTNMQGNSPVVTNIREFQKNAALAIGADFEPFFIKFEMNSMNNNNSSMTECDKWMNVIDENINKVISMNSNIVKPCGITFSPNGQQVACFLLANFSDLSDATFKNEKETLIKNLNDKYYASIWFRHYPSNVFEDENNETGSNDNDENIKKLSNKELITYWESEEANDLKKDYFDKMKQFLKPTLTYVHKNRHNINSGLLVRLKESSVEIQMLDEVLHLSDNKYLYIFDLLVNQGFENFEHKFWSVKSKFFNRNIYFKDNNLLGMNWEIEYYVYFNLLNQQWCQNEAAAIALHKEIDIFKDRMSVEQSRCNVVNLAKIIICCHLIIKLINGGESDINIMVESCKKWFTK